MNGKLDETRCCGDAYVGDTRRHDDCRPQGQFDPRGRFRPQSFRSDNMLGLALVVMNSTTLTKHQSVVYDDIVSVANAGWMRLHFGQDTRIGEGSFIRVTSLRDGEVQELDAANYSQWRGTSAYFNGNSLRVEVIAGGLTRNAISIDTATWEPLHPDRVGGCGICGADDRVPSSDNRFARLMPTGCSATMYNADSCFVSVVEFITTSANPSVLSDRIIEDGNRPRGSNWPWCLQSSWRLVSPTKASPQQRASSNMAFKGSSSWSGVNPTHFNLIT